MKSASLALTLLCLALPSKVAAASDSDFTQLQGMFSQGNYQSVIKLADSRVKKNPRDINAYYFLGLSYYKLENYDQAIQSLLEFDKLHDQIEAQKKQQEARGSETDFLWIDAWYFPAYYLLGEHYFGKSNFSKAEKHLRRAKAGYSQDRTLFFYLGVSSLELKKYEAAHKSFRKMIELDPKEPSPLYNIACVYAMEGNAKEAISWLAQAIKMKPDYKREAASDRNFDSIRNNKEFKKLIAQ